MPMNVSHGALACLFGGLLVFGGWCACGPKPAPAPTPRSRDASARLPPRDKPVARPQTAFQKRLAKLRVVLPSSLSQTVPVREPYPDVAAVEVIVAKTAILVGGKKIATVMDSRLDAVLKRHGPEGYLVSPLYRALRAEHKRIREEVGSDDDNVKGQVILAMDTTMRYRLLAEVIHSIRSAGFRVFQLATNRVNGSTGVVVVRFPKVASKRPGTRLGLGLGKPESKGLDLKVVLTKAGIAIKSQSGSECGKTTGAAGVCISRGAGAALDKVLLRKLQLRMWTLFAQKYKANKWHPEEEGRHRVTLVPTADTAYGDVLRTIDALRLIPKAARTPKAPKVPAVGCKLRHTSDGWDYAFMGKTSVQKRACMYDRVVLDSGAPAVTYPWKNPATGRDHLGR